MDKIVKVSALREGMMVDLEGDQYADPKHDHPEYEYEYCVVDQITQESPGVILVEFRNSACGFPPEHMVRISE